MKKPVNKLLKPEPELVMVEDKEYKVEILRNSTIKGNENVKSQLFSLYYLVS